MAAATLISCLAKQSRTEMGAPAAPVLTGDPTFWGLPKHHFWQRITRPAIELTAYPALLRDTSKLRVIRKDDVKPISISIFVGVLLALGVIYVLQPLNAGAVSLVVVLCVGAATSFGALFQRRSGPKGGDKNE